MLPNLLIAISALKDVYVAEWKQFGVGIESTLITFDEDQKENILFKIGTDVLFYSLQSLPASEFT